ncbi:MAG: protein-L-isoaspartate(D-aspartate) O-methyltransferase [Verrucomicrobia bacterium]|nr:protein-L-isoaspartate(D-aspartate) O-methyltransferase [Verrucomicrobiota bacterium]
MSRNNKGLSLSLKRPKVPDFTQLRHQMVELQLISRGIESRAVLEAMRRVPRELFVPEELRDFAYEDNPLPIGFGQTISQPYIVALMSELAQITPGDRVLEIGTGCGYAAAVLAELEAEVYTVERVFSLGEEAKNHLETYPHVHVRIGDGSLGWVEEAPFDAILVTCAAPSVPLSLIEQLKVGGRLMIPLEGDFYQILTRFYKQEDGTLRKEELIGVRFVPLVPGAPE